jgi:hypothetical protein
MPTQVIRTLATGIDSSAKALALASIGRAFEFYDFVIFAFFASIIARLFFPPSLFQVQEKFQTRRRDVRERVSPIARQQT